MQTPVRYYITQDDDRPVVRTVPVTTRPLPKAVERPAERREPAETGRALACSVPAKRGPVRRIVRAAVSKAHRSTS